MARPHERCGSRRSYTLPASHPSRKPPHRRVQSRGRSRSGAAMPHAGRCRRCRKPAAGRAPTAIPQAVANLPLGQSRDREGQELLPGFFGAARGLGQQRDLALVLDHPQRAQELTALSPASPRHGALERRVKTLHSSSPAARVPRAEVPRPRPPSPPDPPSPPRARSATGRVARGGAALNPGTT